MGQGQHDLGGFFLSTTLMALVHAGCSQGVERPTNPATTSRDSAGVQIVELSELSMSGLPQWRLTSAPAVSVGSVEGEQPYLLTDVKPTGFASLPDGSLAIVDGINSTRGSREIRIFDAAGAFIRAVGRSGEGPGEFTSPPDIQVHELGGVIAFERTNRRVSVFDASGVLLDTWTADPALCPQVPCNVLGGVLQNGAVPLLHQPRPNVTLSMVGQVLEGTLSYGLATGSAYVHLATFPAPEVRVFRVTLSGGREAAVTAAPLLTSLPVVATGSGHLAIGFPESGEVWIFDATGTLVRIIRLQTTPQRLTSAERDRVLADQPPPLLDGQTVREYWPRFRTLRFGDQDDLWIAEHPRTVGSEPPPPERITILAVDGTPLARLEVGAGTLVAGQTRAPGYDIASSRSSYRVVTQDPLGVQRVVVFDIEEP